MLYCAIAGRNIVEMFLDPQTLKERIGRLSYLDGAESMKEDMVKILEFSTLVERISEDGVGDVIVDPEHTLRLREDRVTEGGIAQELLKNSSCTFGNFFSVQNKKDE
eukprot:Stramenopile-MAST_4_protein_5587